MACVQRPGVRPDGLVVRNLDSAALQLQAAALYRRVFAYDEPDVGLSPPLLATLLRNGGSAIGITGPGEELLAFAYGLPASDDTGVYHYSQAAVVAPSSQGRGLGRLLKHAQADAVRAAGMRFMRWSYDPLLSRNAHFNLSVLGAVGRWYVDDYFFRQGSDRVIVEWDLTAADRPAAPPRPRRVPDRAGWGRAWREGERWWLPIPADPAAATAAVRGAVRAGFHELLGAGLAAVACVRCTGDTSAYLFADHRSAA